MECTHCPCNIFHGICFFLLNKQWVLCCPLFIRLTHTLWIHLIRVTQGWCIQKEHKRSYILSLKRITYYFTFYWRNFKDFLYINITNFRFSFKVYFSVIPQTLKSENWKYFYIVSKGGHTPSFLDQPHFF